MPKLLLTASMCLSLLIVGCAAKPHARSSPSTATAAATPASEPTARKSVPALPPTLTTAPSDPNNKVITHIVSKSRTITITSSPKGLLYSLTDASGNVQLAEATPEKFAELHPQLYQQIQHYIAVHADDAPIPSAESADVDASIRTGGDASRRSFRGSSSGAASDSFKRTTDRPFPTAREDAP